MVRPRWTWRTAPAMPNRTSARTSTGQMRERVAGLKGTFSLRSAPGQGTEIQVTLATAGMETSRQE